MLADGRAVGGGGYDAAGLAMPGEHTAMGVDGSDVNSSRALVPHLPPSSPRNLVRVCAREGVWAVVLWLLIEWYKGC
jgi:hypothetical protein